MKVNKKCNEDVYCFYKPYQWFFNAFANKWDLCVEFNFRCQDGYDSDSDSDYDETNYPAKFVSQPTSAPLPAPMDIIESEDSSVAPTHSPDLLTVAKHLQQGIGFCTLLLLTCTPWQLTVNQHYVPKTLGLSITTLQQLILRWQCWLVSWS